VETLPEREDVYGHCCRALDRSLAVGAHGLPLIGTCDWNDGMNRVGREGRGESVWLGFFLFQTLGDFAPLCRARGDSARAERYEAHRAQLAAALEGAWDGRWYRRAYYDDGTPLGTAAAEECRIDVLPQAWAAMTGAVSRQRSERALDAMERELVREADGMIRLLWPPFDRTPQDPGYIRGYLPGIRENGGQYTHAALWAVRGLAAASRRERAALLLERLTPVHHTRSAAATAIYQVEPYWVAADLYGVAPHVGRGGWTGYTGSAGWMLRVALESVLGIVLEGGDTLVVRPCIPDAWPGFRVALRLADGRTQVELVVRNASGRAANVIGCLLDGTPAPIEGGAAHVPVPRDGARHRLEIELG
jgi:cyclic beta-1,2-glucan synthetase